MNDAEKSVVLTIATVGSFLTPFMSSSVNIALPSIGSEFAIDAILLGWIAASFLLAAALFLVPLGKIADIHGRKKIFTFGIVTYTISSLLCAFSASAESLIFFRVVQGFGSAMIFGTGIAMLTSVFPTGERGKALGINVAAVYLGLSLGPFFGGVLTQQFGWRSIFLFNVPLGFLVTVLIFWKLKGEWAEARGERFDLTGSVLYSLTLIAIMYGFSLLPSMQAAWLMLIGTGGFFTFVVWEVRVKNPVLDMHLFMKNRVFAFSNLAALVHYSATFAVTFLLSLYLQYIKEFSPRDAGLILISQPVVMAAFSPFAGRLSDRVEPRIVASTGMALTALGLFLFTLLTEDTALLFIIASLILIGFGFALFSSPNTNAIMSSVERRFYGVASGTLGTMRLVGQMLSMGIALLIFALYIGRVQITPDLYPFFLRSLKPAFLIFAGLCFLGTFASLARGKMR